MEKLYYSIGEVSEIVGVKPHVLRYWESRFPILKPRKNRAGNRNYRIKDIKYIVTIKNLLYEKKFTIEGAIRKFRELKNNPDLMIKQLSIPFAEPEKLRLLSSLKSDLLEIKDLVDSL